MYHSKLFIMKTFFLAWMLALGIFYRGFAQVGISAGTTITENFSIGPTATATLPAGWKADKNTTVRTVGSYEAAGTATEQRAGNNMSSTAGNGIYNYGAGDAATSTDRAVGGLSTGTAAKSVNIYLHFFNNGTIPISDFTVSYAVEKYRDGTNTAGFSVMLYYSTDGIAWTPAGDDFLTSFAGPDPTNTGYPEAPAITTNISGKTLPVMVAAGSNLYLAWNYSVTSGTTTSNAQALGVDDVSITANGGSAPLTYTWNRTGTASWTTPSNWTPTRTAPLVNDILRVVSGNTCTITGMPTQTIGQLIISGNTTVNLQSDAASILNIGGGNGPDFEVQSGSSLILNGSGAISIAVGSGASGSIGGQIISSPTTETANRLTAVDPGTITFSFGASYTAGGLSTGNPFGTTSLASVLFTNGSSFIHQAGLDPFGAAQPNSVVIFQPGSLYKVIAGVPVSFSGRTYANFELDAIGVTVSPDGDNPLSINNLTITNGTLNVKMTGNPGHSIQGNIFAGTGGVLNFAPEAPGTVTMNGICLQAISGAGTITGNANSTIEIANGDGVTLNTNLSTQGNLQLTYGLLTLGASDLIFGPSSAITGTPSVSAMIVATSTGQVKKEFSAPGSFTYPVGDHTLTAEYTPVTLNFTSGIFGTGNHAGVRLVNAKYPDDPNTGNYLNRYWIITSGAISAFSCNALFQYVPEDVSGTEDQIYCVKVDPLPFTTYDVCNGTLHQLTSSGLNSFSTFTGTAAAPDVYDVAGSGFYCVGSPGLPVTLSGSQTSVSYQLRKDGINLGNPVSGTGQPLTWENLLAGIYTVVGTNLMGNTLMNGSAIIEEISSSVANLTIEADANPICEGDVVTFTATPVNGGTAAVYQWFVNGLDQGVSSSQFSYAAVDDDEVWCILTSSEPCVTGNPATSNTVTMIVNPVLAVSIEINPSANPICPGTPVTFAATVINGGSNPQYQWKVNGVNAGSNMPIFTGIMINNDAVTCELSTGLACTPENPVISNTVIMIVNEIMFVSVSIEASANPVSAGAEVTFTAAPVNGGIHPAYQWMVNGVNAGANNPVFTLVPSNNDKVVCILTSDLLCVACNPAISNTIIMTVNGDGFENPNFVVYPNPTTGIYTLEQKDGGEFGMLKVELFGLQGEKLMTTELTGEKKHEFSLSAFPAGLYIMQISTGETSETHRIMKYP